MSQKLPANGFKGVENTSQFYEDLINSRDEGYFLEIDVKYPEKLHNFDDDSPFLPERMLIENCKFT